MIILTRLELSHVAKKIKLVGGDYILLIDTTEEKSLQSKLGMKNIFRINNKNEILWQVNIANSVEGVTDTFMYVNLNNEDSLSADTFFGTEYSIDIKTGIAKRTGWHK